MSNSFKNNTKNPKMELQFPQKQAHPSKAADYLTL